MLEFAFGSITLVKSVLQRGIHKLKVSPFGEIFRRLKAVYEIMDRRGKQSLVVVQLNQIAGVLMGTVALGGMAAFLIILSKPQIIIDNRYVSMIYHGLEFENQSYFLVLLSGLLVLFVAVQQVLGVVLGLLGTRLTQGINRRCAVMLYRFYLTESYEDRVRRGTGDVIGKGLMAAGEVVMGEATRLSHFSAAAINVFFIICALYFVHAGALAVLLLTTVVFYYLFFAAYKNRTRFLGKQLYEIRLRQIRMFREGTAAATEIGLMGKERDFVETVDQSMRAAAKHGIRQAIINSIPQPSIRIAGMTALYIVSAYIFLNDSPGSAFPTLALFAVGTFRLLPSMQGIFQVFMALEGSAHKYQSAMEDLCAAKSRAMESEESGKRFELIEVKDKVVFDNVTYSYPEAGKAAINNVSFSLPANKVIALFGRSGVGKSTVIRLLTGLLSPEKGRVLVDGRPLHGDIDFKRNWQQSSAVVFQKPFFMDASLAMNVAFEATEGKIDYERVREAIKLAQLEDFTRSLPDGLDTKVEEDAEILSGGQRQRLAIARALYRRLSVLILDEATNSLDLVVEKRIIKSLMSIAEGKMVIIIAHRPETMQFADRVIVMKEDGSVAQGVYDELLEKDADFRALIGSPELLAS